LTKLELMGCPIGCPEIVGWQKEEIPMRLIPRPMIEEAQDDFTQVSKLPCATSARSPGVLNDPADSRLCAACRRAWSRFGG